jgi:TonB family protein
MREFHMETLDNVVPASAFASLPESPIHWSMLAVGYLAQTLLLVFFATTSISFMAPVLNPIDTSESVHLVAPMLSPVPQESKPVPVARKMPAPKLSVTPKLQVQLPKVTPPPIEVPKPQVEVAKVTPPTVPAVAKPDAFRNPELALGGSSARVTEHKPPRQVQTGGFGDPNGVPPNSNSTGKGSVIAKLGSFDLPEGSGSGNGTAGSKGTRGAVASAGFGNGIAGPGEGGSGAKGDGKVRTTNFGNAEPAPSEGPKRQAAIVSKDTPVSVLSKPIPSYTLEARQRKIEGDVELEVEFTATGQVHVLRVVQGLGYGLDESAVKAAEKIRFAPARRDGQATDTQGRLRIVFRLS